MGKSVFKDLIREIKGSLGRFIAIMAITAIGAAFFAGVTASSGDMKRSSDNYYDEYNMNDLRIISSIGLTDDDLQVIAKVQGVKAVYGANSKDVLINYDDKESVAHVLSIPLNVDDNDDSYINRLRIKEGRLPQNDKECVVKYESTREAVKVGDVLKFESGTSDDINDTFKDTEYTVVGVVYSPCFVSYDLGSSDIGNGNISYCVYVGDDEFKNDYYTEAYAVVDGAKELDTYSDEYDKKVENVQNRIKNIAAGQLDNRKKDIKEEFAKAKCNFICSFDGGETMLHLAQRIYNLLDDIKAQPDKTYLLVAHNGIARMVKSYFEDMGNEEFSAFKIKNCEILKFEF